MNILIAGDNKEYSSYIIDNLKSFFNNQIKFFIAINGKETVKSAQLFDIDLIILDLDSENLNGIETAKVLHHIEKTQIIPVIFITQVDFSTFKKYGFELGTVDYISKPVDINTLIYRINLYKSILEQNRVLHYANQKLESRIYKEKLKSKIHEDILFHQSKTSALGEMIGAIAHQWRQPLNIISTSIMNLETKAQLELLDIKEIERISKKINTTLAFLSKTIDEFRNFFLSSKQKENVDLVKTIDSTIDIVKTQFGVHNININFNYNETKSYIYNCYRNELRQVFLNLLSNSKDAIEYQFKENNMNIGKIDITLTQNREFFEIMFCDNGGGIEETIIDKIFNPYFSTKFADQGTGTGLYLAKTIIEKVHKGKIAVTNFNNGVCFKLILFR